MARHAGKFSTHEGLKMYETPLESKIGGCFFQLVIRFVNSGDTSTPIGDASTQMLDPPTVIYSRLELKKRWKMRFP